jgi:hypothetical protein
MTRPLPELAADARQYFVENPHEETWHLAPNAPEWIAKEGPGNGGLLWRALGSIVPDAWGTHAVVSVLDVVRALPTTVTRADVERDQATLLEPLVDVFLADLTTWLHSNVLRAAYVDFAVIESGLPDGEFDLFGVLQMGQAYEFRSILTSILDCLEAHDAATHGPDTVE